VKHLSLKFILFLKKKKSKLIRTQHSERTRMDNKVFHRCRVVILILQKIAV